MILLLLSIFAWLEVIISFNVNIMTSNIEPIQSTNIRLMMSSKGFGTKSTFQYS